MNAYFKLKTKLPKEILLSLSNISVGSNVFKCRLQQWLLNASLGVKDLVKLIHNIFSLWQCCKYCNFFHRIHKTIIFLRYHLVLQNNFLPSNFSVFLSHMTSRINLHLSNCISQKTEICFLTIVLVMISNYMCWSRVTGDHDSVIPFWLILIWYTYNSIIKVIFCHICLHVIHWIQFFQLAWAESAHWELFWYPVLGGA